LVVLLQRAPMLSPDYQAAAAVHGVRSVATTLSKMVAEGRVQSSRDTPDRGGRAGSPEL